VLNAISDASAAAEKASLASGQDKHPLPGPDDPPWKMGGRISRNAISDAAAAAEKASLASRSDEHPHDPPCELGGRISQHGCDIPGTGTTFTALSNQIASVDPLLKELSALYEGNSTQPETDKCKIFIAAKMERVQDIPKQRDRIKESRVRGAKCGRTKGKTCRVVYSVQQEAKNAWDNSCR
jgi:hypothetical protein